MLQVGPSRGWMAPYRAPPREHQYGRGATPKSAFRSTLLQRELCLTEHSYSLQRSLADSRRCVSFCSTAKGLSYTHIYVFIFFPSLVCHRIPDRAPVLPYSRTLLEVKLLSRVRLFAIPWTVAYQAPPSTEFPRQEYWSGLLFPSPEFQINSSYIQ